MRKNTTLKTTSSSSPSFSISDSGLRNLIQDIKELMRKQSEIPVSDTNSEDQPIAQLPSEINGIINESEQAVGHRTSKTNQSKIDKKSYADFLIYRPFSSFDVKKE